MREESVFNYFIVNGGLCSTKDTQIFSRITGESLYEVVKLIDGVPLFFEDHMDRFRASAKSSGLTLPKSDSEILEEIALLVKKNRYSQINTKLLYCKPDGEDYFFTYFIKVEYPEGKAYERGVHTILFEGERENPNIKTVKDSFRYRVQSARNQAGAYEALLTDRDGFISEGSRSNIFFVKGGKIYTPPAGAVLMGVTRKYVMELCRELGIKVIERPLHKDELAETEGAFITGTTVDVLPIASIGEQRIDSLASPHLVKIIETYKNKTAEYVSSRP